MHYDGKPLNQITLIGQVTQAEELNINQTYTLDDGTGSIQVKVFVESNDDPTTRRHVAIGSYVRVFGQISTANKERTVTAFQINTIVDFNERTLHILEVIRAHIFNTQSVSSLSASLVPAGFGEYGQPVTSASLAEVPAGNFNPVQHAVLQVFMQDMSEAGTSVDAVCRALSGYSRQAIREAIDLLCGDGHLYSTVDEDHFKSTAGS